MQFEINMKITEQDYLEFNYFHLIESAQGKKALMKRRVLTAVLIALLSGLVLMLANWGVYGNVAYLAFVGVYTIIDMLLMKKSVKRNIRNSVNHMKKEGKLPFDEESKYEFFEDVYVETSRNSRTELKYEGIERVCVVKERFVLIYSNSATAHVLPFSQLCQQVDADTFLTFLSQKCGEMEYYK